jgi:hypothetical protein
MKEHEMRAACGMHGGNQKYIQNFGREMQPFMEGQYQDETDS